MGWPSNKVERRRFPNFVHLRVFDMHGIEFGVGEGQANRGRVAGRDEVVMQGMNLGLECVKKAFQARAVGVAHLMLR